MLSLLSARSTLRLAGGAISRPAAVPAFSRVAAFSFRTFLTTTRVQEPAAKAKVSTKSKTASGAKTKRTTAKAKTTKASGQTKSGTRKAPATKRVKKTKPNEKPVKKFNRKLMTPPKQHGRSSYVVFMGQYIAEQKQLNKDTDVKELLKQAVHEWQGMSDAQKEAYAKPVQANKEEWERLYEAWYRALPKGYLRQINRERKEKGKLLLRRPKGMRGPARAGYIYFFRDYLQTGQTADMTVSVAASNAGKAWRALSQEERDKYNERAHKAFEDFRKSRDA